jgi:predicted SAM-dependent methyltransferase
MPILDEEIHWLLTVEITCNTSFFLPSLEERVVVILCEHTFESFVISGFCRHVDGNCAFLWYYVLSNGNLQG